jgi:hypothetical protein
MLSRSYGWQATDRGKQFGGERSMLLLPVRADDLSVGGTRTRSAFLAPFHEVTDIFTTAIRSCERTTKLVPGNTRDCTASFEAMMLYQLSYCDACAPRDGFEPPTFTLAK